MFRNMYDVEDLKENDKIYMCLQLLNILTILRKIAIVLTKKEFLAKVEK